MRARGGAIEYRNGYKIHKFGEDGVFTVLGDGGEVELVVVAGGGAGQRGGGGAGGYRRITLTLPAGTYNITVGKGGHESAGHDSRFSDGDEIDYIAHGGGRGGGIASAPTSSAGSGGGAFYTQTPGQGNKGEFTPDEGHDGGTGDYLGLTYGGGGGAEPYASGGDGELSQIPMQCWRMVNGVKVYMGAGNDYTESVQGQGGNGIYDDILDAPCCGGGGASESPLITDNVPVNGHECYLPGHSGNDLACRVPFIIPAGFWGMCVNITGEQEELLNASGPYTYGGGGNGRYDAEHGEYGKDGGPGVVAIRYSDLARLQTLSNYRGNISDIDINRTSAAIKTKNIIELLSVPFPRMTYQAPCTWRLYDDGCMPLAFEGSVTSGGVSVIGTDLTQEDGYFDLGTIYFTSGACLGITASVLSYASGAFTLVTPLSVAPSADDGFIAKPNNRTIWTVEGIVAAGSTALDINSSLREPDGHFNLGVIYFTSGVCAGSRRTVSSFLSEYGTISIILPLKDIPADGDTFKIYPGCDHTHGLAVTLTGSTHSNTIIDGISDTSGLIVGILVMGQGIPPSVITLIDGPTQIEISNPATASASISFTCFQAGNNGCSKFGNWVNFRGCPYIPVPETAL